jgi:hypothetical protein
MTDPPPSATLMRLQVMIVNFLKVEDGSLITDVNLRKYGIEAGEPVTNAILQELCILHKGILRLDMSLCKAVSDVGMWSVSKHLIHLQHLVITGCDKVTTVGIRALSLSLIRLKSIDLSYCYLLDDISMTVIAAGSWKLERILLAYCNKITDNGIKQVSTGLGGTIRVLDCKGCTNIGEKLKSHCHFKK